MTSSQSGGADGASGYRSRPDAILMGVSIFNLILGLCFFLFLVALPSDPERAQIGRYSQERIQLILGMVAATAAWAILSLALALKEGWRTSLGEALFGKARWAQRLVPVVFLLLLSLFVWLVMYYPTRIELTKYHYIRLAPYLLWPWLFLASVAVGAKLASRGFRPRVEPRVVEGAAILGLFFLSFAARASLSGYALPYQQPASEVVTYVRALELISGKSLFNVGDFATHGNATYGDPLLYVTAAGQVAGLLVNLRTGAAFNVGHYASPADGVASVLEAVHVSGAPLQYPRLLLSLINSLTVVLIYAILRCHFEADGWISFAGGLVYAVISSSVVIYSAFIWPDGLATTLATAAFYLGLGILRSDRPGWLSEIACAFLVGAALSTTIRYVALIPVPFVALALSRSHRNWIERALVMGGALALGLLATSPTLIRDLPGYLARMTDLAWFGDGSLHNRVPAMAFYLGHVLGLGIPVFGLSLVGFTLALQRWTRSALLLTVYALAHFLVITTTIYRSGTHALPLSVLASIFAALGLLFVQELLQSVLRRARPPGSSRPDLERLSRRAAGAVALLLLLALSLAEIRSTIGAINGFRSFKPSQVRMAEYIRDNLQQDTRMALLDIVPFANVHLELSGADVHRVPLSITLGELRAEGYKYVIGTNLVGSAYAKSEGTIWVSGLVSDQQKVVEFGQTYLFSRDTPVADILLYLSSVPIRDS